MSTSTPTMTETAENTSTFRSYASRRSLLDHHIPTSELELGIMNKQDNMEGAGEFPSLGPVLGTSTDTSSNVVSASAPTSPTDHTESSRPTTTPLVIPTDHYDGRIPSNRGPPRSALPDFLPPSKPEAGKENVRTASPAPVSAYTQPQPQPQSIPLTHKQPEAGPSGPPKRLLSTHMVDHPDDTVRDAIKERFPLPNPLVRLFKRFRVKHSVIEGMTKEEMDHWEAQRETLMQKAGWKIEGSEGPGTEVTELYWKMYLSLMPTLERDPLSGLVPPDLIGSTGVMPLSVISLIPDIMAHYRDVIVRAEKEVFLVTNYWQPSNSVSTIVKALRDLSAAVVKSGRPPVVVKLMYDRGSWEQLWNSHAPVAPEKWATIDLPTQKEVPGIDLEVINFHRVLLGTFHAKFLVVDRKVALLNSNNIQDRPNLELMSHFEGPIVDSFYEIALQSWYNRLSPPLPFIATPYQPPRDANGNIRYRFADRNPYFDDIEVVKAAKAARQLLRDQTKDTDLERDAERQTFTEAVRRKIDQQRASFATWAPGEQLDMRAQQAMRDLREFRDKWSWNPSRSGSRAPSRRPSYTEAARPDMEDTIGEESRIREQSEARSSPTMVGGEVPMPKSKTYPDPSDAHPLNRPHVAFAGLTDSTKVRDGPMKTDEEGQDQASVEGPSDPSKRIAPATVVFTEQGGIREGPVDGPEHVPLIVASPSGSMVDVRENQEQSRLEPPKSLNVPGEDKPRMSGESEVRPEGTGTKRMFQLSKRFNAGALSDAWATVEDSDEFDNFRPHVVHAPHDPVPIAMCCRKPHGFPGHHDIRNPQNAAWLAGFRYAKKKVFVQSPTLNARPIVRAIKQTCRRGVEVILFLDLGFNDKGESIPFQGGTNEEVVDRLYKALSKEKKEQYLKVYWYTGKDQVRPLNAVKKQRNCHIKFAAYDDQVLILGNGNQDSQSWFHSQEVNVMIDSKQLVAEMMDTLMSNQNTMKYGLVSPDGIWRDGQGKTLQDYGATGSDKFRGLSAFINIIKTI